MIRISDTYILFIKAVLYGRKGTYEKMYDGMIAKNEEILREVLDDSFVLVHMTGMRQPKGSIYQSGTEWNAQLLFSRA